MKILAIAALAAGMGTIPLYVQRDLQERPHTLNPRRPAGAVTVPRNQAVAPVSAMRLPAEPSRAMLSVSARSNVAAAIPVSPRMVERAPVRHDIARHAADPHEGVDGGENPVDVSGVNPIELTIEEMAKLGMRPDSDGVWMVWHEPGKPEPFAWAITARGMLLPDDGIRLEGLDIPDFMPVMITDDRGMKRASIYDDAPIDSTVARAFRMAATIEDTAAAIRALREKAIEQRDKVVGEMMGAGRLVPLIVHAGRPHTAADSIAGRWRPDCIVWYEPTPDLVAKLPARVRKRLSAEILRAASLVERERLMETDPAGMLGRSGGEASAGERPYLDILRSASGALAGTSLVPNPTEGPVVLSYRLTQPRMISIAMYDITGRMLRRIAPPAGRSEGTTELIIDTEGLSEGIYLVVISTDKGEKGVQRLIVR